MTILELCISVAVYLFLGIMTAAEVMRALDRRISPNAALWTSLSLGAIWPATAALTVAIFMAVLVAAIIASPVYALIAHYKNRK